MPKYNRLIINSLQLNGYLINSIQWKIIPAIGILGEIIFEDRMQTDL